MSQRRRTPVETEREADRQRTTESVRRTSADWPTGRSI